MHTEHQPITLTNTRKIITIIYILPEQVLATLSSTSVLINYCLASPLSDIVLLPIAYSALINHAPGKKKKYDHDHDHHSQRKYIVDDAARSATATKTTTTADTTTTTTDNSDQSNPTPTPTTATANLAMSWFFWDEYESIRTGSPLPTNLPSARARLLHDKSVTLEHLARQPFAQLDMAYTAIRDIDEVIWLIQHYHHYH